MDTTSPLMDERSTVPVIEAWFDDLYIYGSRRADATSNSSGSSDLYQGIYYTVTDSYLNVTYILSRKGTYESYIFSITYSTLHPGSYGVSYTSTGGPGSAAADTGVASFTGSNDGLTAAIGVQAHNANGTYDAIQWSYNQTAVYPGYAMVCDTDMDPPVCEGSDGRYAIGIDDYSP